ncbi:MAG: ketohexokinase [Gammaproteobacteria bacterium]|nr:ketohexokinase [Gammaproteobacteria bacterium]
MQKILAVGIATIDIINELSQYPKEDSEQRIISQRNVRGGNATNLLAILSQLNYQTFWAGTLAKDSYYSIIKNDLDSYFIDDQFIEIYEHHSNPVSYIIYSQKTSSRTIVHYRDLPEYSFQQFKSLPLEEFNWLHFEGRNIDEVLKMQQYCKQYFPELTISTEIEKNRRDIKQLWPLSDVLFFSKSYALDNHSTSAKDFLTQHQNQFENKVVSCTWGEQGASLYGAGEIISSPAFINENTVDTIGAGDSFNAGLIDALIRSDNFNALNSQQVLEYACKTASLKCSRIGFNLSL